MIFYFTATGNSKYIAEKIAAGTGGRIINITDCIQNEQYSFEPEDGEQIGFVIPVYFFGIPMIVTEFLQKLNVFSKHDIYSYAILNCGGTTANAEYLFQHVFQVNAVFGIVTVDNYVPMYKVESEANIKEQLDKAEREISTIIEHISRKDTGTFNNRKGHLPNLFTFFAYPLYKNGRKTNKFTVNQNCTGCGLCEKICPREVIRLKDGKPVWTIPQCELCLGCLHRCPAAAIDYGKKSANHGRYVNPRIRF